MPQTLKTLKVLRPGDYRRAAWKNGLGHTDEIAIHPAGSDLRRGDFVWRVSSARIERASPFSAFPQHDRILVVLTGDGVRLFHSFEEGGEEDQTELPPLEIYEFPGDIPSRCELLGSPVTDLSVFIQKGDTVGQADVLEVAEGDSLDQELPARWSFTHVARGEFEIESGELGVRDVIRPGDTLAIESDGADPVHVTYRCASGEGRLVVVQLQQSG